MNALAEKLHLLERAAPDPETFGRLVDKLVLTLSDEYRERIARLDAEIAGFEHRFGLSSEEFSQRFERGELDDRAEWFDWEALVHLREAARRKLAELERATG
jgi:hypothetical protein